MTINEFHGRVIDLKTGENVTNKIIVDKKEAESNIYDKAIELLKNIGQDEEAAEHPEYPEQIIILLKSKHKDIALYSVPTEVDEEVLLATLLRSTNMVMLNMEIFDM